jgi:hypothetical protein
MGKKPSLNKSDHDADGAGQTPSVRKIHREMKTERVDKLRRKKMGFSIGHISVEPSISGKSGKKIKFDDDDGVFSESHDADEKIRQKSFIIEHVNESSDEGDMIEEVRASDAKIHALRQNAEEEAMAQEEISFSKRKRKHRKKDIRFDADSDADDLSLDDEMFAMVDAEKERLHAIQPASKGDPAIKRNIHITFKLGLDDEPGTLNNPIRAGQNIQVVVLPQSENNVISKAGDTFGVVPSRTALQLCRNRIIAAQSLINMDRTKTKGRDISKKQAKSLADDQIIKRSRKSKYHFRLGRSAANFLVNK